MSTGSFESIVGYWMPFLVIMSSTFLILGSVSRFNKKSGEADRENGSTYLKIWGAICGIIIILLIIGWYKNRKSNVQLPNSGFPRVNAQPGLTRGNALVKQATNLGE